MSFLGVVQNFRHFGGVEKIGAVFLVHSVFVFTLTTLNPLKMKRKVPTIENYRSPKAIFVSIFGCFILVFNFSSSPFYGP